MKIIEARVFRKVPLVRPLAIILGGDGKDKDEGVAGKEGDEDIK